MTEPSRTPPAGTSESPAPLPATGLERAFDLYRETARSRSAAALLVANVIPLVGVLFLGWSLWTILVIYWVENGIVGLWNIPRILLAQGQLLPGRSPGTGYRSWAVQSIPAAARVGLAVFFAVHYGLFWVVHGVFVLVLPQFMGAFGGGLPTFPGGPGFPGDLGLPGGVGVPGGVGSGPFGLGLGTGGAESAGPFGALDWAAVGLAALGLFLSHGASFVLNYVGRGEYRTTWATAQMFAPYGRVVVLHITILLGGFAVAFLGAPLLMLLALVILKTAFDLGLHLREHRDSSDAALEPSG